jgi:hypothetical protein
MINPLNSPWNRPKFIFIQDIKLYRRWQEIKKHLTTNPCVIERNGYLEVNGCYIAKNSSKMRLKSHLDWCHYTPKTLAQAIDSDTIESYYEVMLKNPQSDCNNWKDRQREMELKSYYANKAGRSSLI